MTKRKSFGRELNTQGGPGRACIPFTGRRPSACRAFIWPALLPFYKTCWCWQEQRNTRRRGGRRGGEGAVVPHHHHRLSLSLLVRRGLSCSFLRSSLSTNQINYSLFSVHRFSSCRLSGHRRRSNNASADDDADAAANNNAAVPAK